MPVHAVKNFISKSNRKIVAAVKSFKDKGIAYEAKSDDENNDDDSDEEGSDWTSDDEESTEINSIFSQWINWLRLYVTYENTKTMFRWLMDYAFVEIRISVSPKY
jgi:hypothetical protein